MKNIQIKDDWKIENKINKIEIKLEYKYEKSKEIKLKI